MSAQRLYSVSVAAHHLGCEPDELIRLIDDGTIAVDDSSGDVQVIAEEQVERAKDALKAQRRQGDES